MQIAGGKVSDHIIRLDRWKAEQAGKVYRKPRNPGGAKLRHALAYLVYWYEDLRSANPRGWRVEPIPFSEIRAFNDLYGMDMDAFDIDTLRKLDVVWLNCLPKDDTEGKGKR
jgi:hypothetical protein